ncbi:MAG TPA: M28 family peptidase [Longimicrobium sp.]|nr:M28 family peptidase [Longimicrobium sp.]
MSGPTRRWLVFRAGALAGLAALAPGTRIAAQAGAASVPSPPALAEALRARVEVLAADSMRGRETGTAGARSAAEYLVRAARALGLEPAGENGGFVQRVPLERRRVNAVVTVTTPRGRTALAPGEAVPLVLNFLPRTYRARGEGTLLYAGYVSDVAARTALLAEPERVAGRVPVFHTGALAAEDAELPLPPIFEVAPLMRPTSGVPAVVFLAEDALARQLARRADLARNGQPGAPQPRRELNAPPVLLVSPAALERALGAPLGTARDTRPLAGTLSYRIRDTVETAEGQEIVAVIPGSDPRLRGQYVALGAHYDHLGVGTPVAGDSIYNGADDNASGVAALLETARRFAALPSGGAARAQPALHLAHGRGERAAGLRLFRRAPHGSAGLDRGLPQPGHDRAQRAGRAVRAGRAAAVGGGGRRGGGGERAPAAAVRAGLVARRAAASAARLLPLGPGQLRALRHPRGLPHLLAPPAVPHAGRRGGHARLREDGAGNGADGRSGRGSGQPPGAPRHHRASPPPQQRLPTVAGGG